MKVKNFVKGFIVGLPITITVFDCVGYVAKVDGVSMQPCLNPESEGNAKDYVLLNRWSVRKYDIQRGNVVSLTSPRDPDQKIIKRVIGLEGDTVKTLSYKQRYVKIPQGHCWVEGDHRSHSMDSNFFGPVAVGLITAKATHIVWPPSRWQRLESRLSPDRTPNITKNVHLESDHHESNLQLNVCENCNNNKNSQECSSFTTYNL